MVKLVEGVPGVYLHYCPGCELYHYFHTTYPNRSKATWSFDGNMTQPTFHPSMNIVGQCHYWLRNGKIEFLGDCDHSLRNQTVDLPEFNPDDPLLQKWIDMLGLRVPKTITSDQVGQ
jgi:hypothetical protein